MISPLNQPSPPPKTEFHVSVIDRNSEKSVNTYTHLNRIAYLNKGVILNPKRPLTQSEVEHLQNTAEALGIDYIKFDPIGYTVFDSHGYGIRSVLCFYDDPTLIGIAFLPLPDNSSSSYKFQLVNLNLTSILETFTDGL